MANSSESLKIREVPAFTKQNFLVLNPNKCEILGMYGEGTCQQCRWLSTIVARQGGLSLCSNTPVRIVMGFPSTYEGTQETMLPAQADGYRIAPNFRGQ